LSISFLFDENRGVASAGLGDAVVGGALSVPDRTARSTQSERLRRLACATGFGSLGRSTSSISVCRRNYSNRCLQGRSPSVSAEGRPLSTSTATEHRSSPLREL